MSWTTPRDLEAQVERSWNLGRLLAAGLLAEQLYPLKLSLKRPSSRELSSRFAEVRQWIRDLEHGSREVRGYGYEIGWTEINHRELGRNRVPCSASVPTEQDALRLIGRAREAQRFRMLCEQTLDEFPTLNYWVARKPLTLLTHADEWLRVLSVLRWFRTHSRPQLYLRQLEIADVDTKFIETHRGLLSQLLDLVLPESALDAGATGSRGFEQRYGLRNKPGMVRFRVLDRRLDIHGLTDLTVPVREFATLRLPVARVFVTENEINGLAFPDLPQSLVVFGLGYGLDALFEVPWLKKTRMYYWGDIDTHGFAILNRLRTVFPDANSLLMDRETLLCHRPLWVPEHKPHLGALPHLTVEEQALFQDLQCDRLGTQVRLEQERVSYASLKLALAALTRGR